MIARASASAFAPRMRYSLTNHPMHFVLKRKRWRAEFDNKSLGNRWPARGEDLVVHSRHDSPSGPARHRRFGTAVPQAAHRAELDQGHAPGALGELALEDLVDVEVEHRPAADFELLVDLGLAARRADETPALEQVHLALLA